MKTDGLLSVVVACYLDAAAIPELYRRLTAALQAVTPHYEIIYVNDASPDQAEAVLIGLAAADPRLVVVNHTRNFGSQNAFLSGMAVSRGDAVVLMDGDLQDPPELIGAFVDRWLEGFQIVYGRRVRRIDTLFRRVAYKVFYRVFRRLARFPVPLDAGDFGLIDRRVVHSLLADFPERLVFLRGLRAYTGFRSTGVEYVRPARADGRSTNSLMGNLRWARLAVFAFSEKPLEYIAALAFGSVCVTMLATVFYLGAYAATWISGTHSAPPGYMTQLLIALFLGSIQLVSLSILAVYIGHIYEEVKVRPRYIVRDVIDRRPAGRVESRP